MFSMLFSEAQKQKLNHLWKAQVGAKQQNVLISCLPVRIDCISSVRRTHFAQSESDSPLCLPVLQKGFKIEQCEANLGGPQLC